MANELRIDSNNIHQTQYESRSIFLETYKKTKLANLIGWPKIKENELISAQKLGKTINSMTDMPIYVQRYTKSFKQGAIQIPLVYRSEGALSSMRAKQLPVAKEMSAVTDTLELDIMTDAIKADWKLTMIDSQLDLESNAKRQLYGNYTDKLDTKIHDVLQANPTQKYFPNGKSTTGSGSGAITSSDKITFDFLREMREASQEETPGSVLRVEPFEFESNEFHIFLMNQKLANDLRQDAEYQDALKLALNRGSLFQHPIFTGVKFMTLDGIVVITSPKCITSTTWGAGAVKGGQVTLMGQRCLAIAEGETPVIREAVQEFQGLQPKWWIEGGFNVKKPKFNNKDYGSYAGYFAHS